VCATGRTAKLTWRRRSLPCGVPIYPRVDACFNVCRSVHSWAQSRALSSLLALCSTLYFKFACYAPAAARSQPCLRPFSLPLSPPRSPTTSPADPPAPFLDRPPHPASRAGRRAPMRSPCQRRWRVAQQSCQPWDYSNGAMWMCWKLLESIRNII
jgi:hypothetical protein